jgi:ribosome recycling factor
MSLPDETKQKMQATVEHFKTELKNLRSNRANPGILDGVMVEVYGTMMKIKELAGVTAPEARQLLISPFDPKSAQAIAKGIEKANLNLLPIVEASGSAIRINIPPMDEAMRKEIVKQAKKKAEDAKIVVREIRRKYNDLVRKEKADSKITEDVMKKMEKSIQEFTDQFCKTIDELFTSKEKEIMTV